MSDLKEKVDADLAALKAKAAIEETRVAGYTQTVWQKYGLWLMLGGGAIAIVLIVAIVW